MHAIINDFAWIFIVLAVITVFFIICVAFIFLDEGVRLIFRKFRRRRSAIAAQPQATATTLPSPRRPLKRPSEASGGNKPVSQGSVPQVLAGTWHAILARLHTATDGAYRPFRLGHR